MLGVGLRIVLSLVLASLFGFSHCDGPFEMHLMGIKTKRGHRGDWSAEAVTRSNPLDYERVIQLSQRPRIFLYKGFLTEKECEHLIELAKGHLTRSMVGIGVLNKGRTSTSMSLRKGADEIVQAIERRLETWTLLPKENAEAIHVIRYTKGQHYFSHHDYLNNPSFPLRGGDRVATVLMYLSDARKGGETYFPDAQRFDHHKYDPLSNCSSSGIAVKPRKGDAVLLFNLHPDESVDKLSVHGSCSVIEGEKWTATSWIRVRAHTAATKFHKKGACFDLETRCKGWALTGQCERDPSVGKRCRKSCNICVDLESAFI